MEIPACFMRSTDRRTSSILKSVSFSPLIASQGRFLRFTNRLTPPGAPITGIAAAKCVASVSTSA